MKIHLKRMVLIGFDLRDQKAWWIDPRVFKFILYYFENSVDISFIWLTDCYFVKSYNYVSDNSLYHLDEEFLSSTRDNYCIPPLK